MGRVQRNVIRPQTNGLKDSTGKLGLPETDQHPSRTQAIHAFAEGGGCLLETYTTSHALLLFVKRFTSAAKVGLRVEGDVIRSVLAGPVAPFPLWRTPQSLSPLQSSQAEQS